jgi:hypothetical protein
MNRVGELPPTRRCFIAALIAAALEQKVFAERARALRAQEEQASVPAA